jgi:hypothetical protein
MFRISHDNIIRIAAFIYIVKYFIVFILKFYILWFGNYIFAIILYDY